MYKLAEALVFEQISCHQVHLPDAELFEEAKLSVHDMNGIIEKIVSIKQDFSVAIEQARGMFCCDCNFILCMGYKNREQKCISLKFCSVIFGNFYFQRLFSSSSAKQPTVFSGMHSSYIYICFTVRDFPMIPFKFLCFEMMVKIME